MELAAGRAGNAELVDEAHHFICCPSVYTAVKSHLLLCRVALDQLVCAETGAAGLAVHKRVGKACQMSACDPGPGIHENCAVNADILGSLGDKLLPPGFFDVVLELNAQVAVIPCVCQTAIDLGTGIDESSVVAQRNDLFHCLFHTRSNSFAIFSYNSPYQDAVLHVHHIRQKAPGGDHMANDDFGSFIYICFLSFFIRFHTQHDSETDAALM